MSKRLTPVRRALVTGALAATLVVGGSGAAMAEAGAHGPASCARASFQIAHLQRKLDRAAGTDHSRGTAEKTARSAQRQAQFEQKLAALEAACPT